MKDIKTKEVTTKPKTKNPASRIPKELMRTAILESKEKSQTIANARDNDMEEQSPSEYASGKVASAEEWAARKSSRTVTSAGKTAAQNERAEDPGCQGDTKNPEWTGNVGRWIAFHQKTKPEKQGRRYRKAECHPPETAGNHPDQGKATETVGAEDHTAAYY